MKNDSKKPVVINVLFHPPDYDAYADRPKPKVNWSTPNGGWVGIWGYDFPNQLGNEVLKITSEFRFEVWQPDLRADRVYSHEFENGLIHRLFPARWRTFPLSFGRRKDVDSPSMVDHFLESCANNAIVQLHNITGILSYRFYQIPTSLRPTIMVTGHGATQLPDQQRKGLARHPLTKLSLFAEERMFYNIADRIDFISDESHYQIDRLKERLKRHIEFVVVGSDFEFWIPKPAHGEIHPELMRHKQQGKRIFLSVVNFRPRKKIDLLIDTFSALRQHDNFLLVIVGHGEEHYTNYLKNLGRDLMADDKLVFMDYMRGEELRSVYWGADYYTLFLAEGEGTSVAMEHAAAVSLPIITTKGNGIADVLESLSCGLVLPDCNLATTMAAIRSVLEGKQLLSINRAEAVRLFSWPEVARQYLEVYRKLAEKMPR